MEMLCKQHGHVHNFFMNQQQGQAFVQYKTRDVAVRAQHALHMLQFAGNTLFAEFVSEQEAAVVSSIFRSSESRGSQPVTWSSGGSSWSSGGGGGGGQLWGDDQTSLLPGGLGL